VIGISPGQGELLGKPALVATNHHSGLSCLSCPRADADGGPRKQQNPHTGCSDAVYFTAHPALACSNGGNGEHFDVQSQGKVALKNSLEELAAHS
jgi:hypothetical protein